jgi:hypothetical protein
MDRMLSCIRRNTDHKKRSFHLSVWLGKAYNLPITAQQTPFLAGEFFQLTLEQK